MLRYIKVPVIMFILIVPLCAFVSNVPASEIQVSHFSTEGLAGWEPKIFKGRTEYLLQKENGRTVVKAVSHAAASGMVRKIHFEPSTYRYLRWSWKIAHTIKGGDEKSKAGDDYAARLYVIFPGRFFWQMKAINYIWANTLPKGEYVPNPFASDAKMLAVESGNGKAGQWVSEERDLLADYRLMFGTDPPAADAIAIMTDTDNTGGNAEAWYGEISLSTVGK
ncbi:MAG TPA: DUF3047 domain-containing protein [Desulfuromonadaceae bacterium]